MSYSGGRNEARDIARFWFVDWDADGKPIMADVEGDGVLDLLQGHAYDCFDLFVRYRVNAR